VTTTIALLRGINVGGHNKVSMTDLRSIVESLGCSDVKTYIQSGNVVFTHPTSISPAAVEDEIEARLGMRVTVVLRTSAAMAKVLQGVPFDDSDLDLARLYVGFMAATPEHARVEALDAEQFLPERFAIVGEELYLYLPHGMGRTKLPAYLDRQLKVPTTVRNWNTVQKLVELSRG